MRRSVSSTGAGEHSELFESARAYYAAVKGLRQALRVRVRRQIESQQCSGARRYAG